MNSGSRHDHFKKVPFEVVVADYGVTVRRVIGAVLEPIDAEDAWSETFLSAIKAYPRLPSDANIEAWLVTIAQRKAIDFQRSAARREIPVASTPDSTAGDRADDQHLDLIDAVAALPTKQRQAVAYHYLAGLPYAAVADIIGGSV